MSQRGQSIEDTGLFDDHSRYVDRFGLLLLVTTVAVVTLSLVDLTTGFQDVAAEIETVVVSIFVASTLLLAVRASGVARRPRLIVDVVVGLGLLATVIYAFTLGATDDSRSINSFAVPLSWTIIGALAPILVVRRLVRHKRATGKTLLGAVSAYLLIALAFAFAFLAIEVNTADPVFGTPQPTTSFMYYSLVTITTLGYGDLAMTVPFGRMMSTLEAVIGQVYLVTFVAMVVGLLVARRRSIDDAEEGSPDPGQ